MSYARLVTLLAFVVLALLVPAALLGCGSGASAPATRESAPPASTPPHIAAPETEAPTSAAPTPGAPPATNSAADECAVDGTAARSVRVTLAHAERQGIVHAHLADCAFDAAHCGAARTGPAEEPDGARCVVDVRTMGGYFQIRVHPRALAGAPRWIDASIDTAASEPPARFYVGASTWSVGQRHSIVVGGVDGHISHTHGGESAHIGHAQLSIRNGSTTPLRVRARGIEWLTSNQCEVPTVVRAQPALEGLTLEGSDARAPEVVVAPGARSTVTASFAPQPAYYSYCNRFAARVTLDVDGETIVAVAEWEVSRREPLRRDVP